MERMPAVSLAAMPGRRAATLELAVEIERRGFAGIYCPSFGDGLGLCEALALCTGEIAFGTAIASIYTRHPADYAQTVALIHELGRGRFHFGVGVSHQPVNERLGVATGKPLADVRRFAEQLRRHGERNGELPPLVLATLRRKMVELAGDIAQGAVWANAARSHMRASLGFLPPEKRAGDSFFIGNMIPTCIADDRAAAAAVMRRTLSGYVALPNYRAYWVEAGYGEEMQAIAAALDAGERERLPELMSDRWLHDVTLFGTAAEVREGVEAWLDAGVRTPILVPSAVRGGQMQGFTDLFAAYAS